MKNLKDYVHFFLGCQFQLFWRNDDGTTEYERDGELVTIRPQDKDTHGLVFRCKTKGDNFIEMAYPFEDVKPIFKPLSDYKEVNNEGLNDINCDLSNQMEIVDLANKQLHFQVKSILVHILLKVLNTHKTNLIFRLAVLIFLY